jgi:hypothetical protein
VEYFNYMGSMVRNDARGTRGMKSGIAIAINNKKFISKLEVNFRKTPIKCYTWS